MQAGTMYYSIHAGRGSQLACSSVAANKFAKQFVVKRWRKDAEKIFDDARASGVKLPGADEKAAVALICSHHIDYHMRDIGLMQRMIHNGSAVSLVEEASGHHQC